MSRVTSGNNKVTQHFSKTHKGIDIAHSTDEEKNKILAHSSGKVTWIQTGQKNNPGSTGNKSYGNAIKIKHSNGYYTLYAHLDSVKVKKGEQVSKGQVIGTMGNTGNSYGKHLHWELRNKLDIRIDPEPYLYSNLPGMSGIVTYQTYDNVKNKWLPKVKSGTKDYAGNFNNGVSGIKISDLKYRSYDLVKKKWLPYVTGDSSYAGNLENNMGGLEIKGAEFEVHTKNGNWQKSINGVAFPSKTIDAVKITKIN